MSLKVSDNDKLALKEGLAKRKADKEDHPACYADCVVIKPWGHEFELFDDKKHAVWLLNLRPQRATSMHCHQRKTALFVPLAEGIKIVTLVGVVDLPYGTSVAAEPGVFHSVWNTSDHDAALLEIETPSLKLDIVRVQDAYGREHAGYEGNGCIVRDHLAQYGHGRISEGAPIQRFGHEISVTQSGFGIRRLMDA